VLTSSSLPPTFFNPSSRADSPTNEQRASKQPHGPRLPPLHNLAPRQTNLRPRPICALPTRAAESLPRRPPRRTNRPPLPRLPRPRIPTRRDPRLKHRLLRRLRRRQPVPVPPATHPRTPTAIRLPHKMALRHHNRPPPPRRSGPQLPLDGPNPLHAVPNYQRRLRLPPRTLLRHRPSPPLPHLADHPTTRRHLLRHLRALPSARQPAGCARLARSLSRLDHVRDGDAV